MCSFVIVSTNLPYLVIASISFSLSARVIISPRLTNPRFFNQSTVQEGFVPVAEPVSSERGSRISLRGCTRDAPRTWHKKKDRPLDRQQPRIEPRALLSPASRKRNASAVTSRKNERKTDDKGKRKNRIKGEMDGEKSRREEKGRNERGKRNESVRMRM